MSNREAAAEVAKVMLDEAKCYQNRSATFMADLFIVVMWRFFGRGEKVGELIKIMQNEAKCFPDRSAEYMAAFAAGLLEMFIATNKERNVA